MRNQKLSRPYLWVPSLYFAEGLPYVAVMTVSLILYKQLGLSNADITFYTSWLYLPWVIKPLWSPFVDVVKTKRWWILTMEVLIGAAFGGVAFTIPTSFWLQGSLFFFWVMAFSSATHDIAADGFYMLALTKKEQAFYVGIRSTFYRVAIIAGQGLLIMLAGTLELIYKPAAAWATVMLVAAALFLLLAAWHLASLPRTEIRAECPRSQGNFTLDIIKPFISFFQKPGIVCALAFMLLYRLPEAFLTKITPLFLLDSVEGGGLALTTAEIGFVQGTVGIVGLTLGGILGGILAAGKGGMKRWLWPMVASITIPDALYIILAYYQPENLTLIGAFVFLEQFGYGFGFTAYMIYLLQFARGENSTAHYAFATGFMALGMMLPGLVSGMLQEITGYLNFFIITTALCSVTFLVSALVKFDANED